MDKTGERERQDAAMDALVARNAKENNVVCICWVVFVVFLICSFIF